MALGGILGGMADLIFVLGMVLFMQLPLLFSFEGVFGYQSPPKSSILCLDGGLE